MASGSQRAAPQEREALHHDMREALADALSAAERYLVTGQRPDAPGQVAHACEVMFGSRTQAYREVAIGCLLTRLHEPERDVRLPYVTQAESAFNGRTLDERVVNPFLQQNSIPCSKGPYLNVFRRQVSFEPATRDGVRDKDGFDALLTFIEAIEDETSASKLSGILEHLLWWFVQLREDAHVDLLQLPRISLAQYREIVGSLLTRASGGRLPLLLVAAVAEAVSETFGLGWAVQCQGINVSDAASAAGGDITIAKDHVDSMVVEVTERPVDRSRVVDTFRSKIGRSDADYVFMVHLRTISGEAHEQAAKYFAQGRDVSFVDLQEWIVNTLALIGSPGRTVFQRRMVEALSAPGIPKVLRVAWNEAVHDAVQ